MEILDLASDRSVSTLNKVVNYYNIPEVTNPYPFDLENPDTHSGKKSGSMSIGSYLVDALAEGVKQNFLGSDINMEFLVLSLRVYLIQLSRLASGYQRNLSRDKYLEREIPYQLPKNAGHLLFN
jgi:hypothetical protein